MVCDGEASTVLLPGPSLTEGFPATNPSLRLLEFDSESFELLDAHTYTADLHAANQKAAARGGGQAAASRAVKMARAAAAATGIAKSPWRVNGQQTKKK